MHEITEILCAQSIKRTLKYVTFLSKTHYEKEASIVTVIYMYMQRLDQSSLSTPFTGLAKPIDVKLCLQFISTDLFIQYRHAKSQQLHVANQCLVPLLQQLGSGLNIQEFVKETN